MDTKKLFSALLLLAGETLIIFCFLNFGKDLDPKILTLDIIVSSIIYLLFFVDLLFPMLNLKDKSQKVVGSLGLRWFFSALYMIIAITLMVLFIWKWPLNLNSQYLIHGMLLFFLAVGLFFALDASQKVKEVFIEENRIRNRLDDMKKATKEVQYKLDQMKDVPANIISRLVDLQENLRFLTPSNNQNAYDLETNFLNEMRALHNCLFNLPLNYDKIIENIHNCERTYKERKQIYSN